MQKQYKNILIRFQYFASLTVMTVNLAAHFLFLMDESGWIQLQLSEWMQGWLVLYPLIWLVPLGWMLILSSLTRITAKSTLLITSVLPLAMLIGRTILYAMGKPWYSHTVSWVFALVQLILLVILWSKTAGNCKKRI